MTDPLVLMSAVRGEHSHVGGMFRGLGVRNLPSVISPRRADVSAALTARRSRARLCSQDLLIALVAQEPPERVHSLLRACVRRSASLVTRRHPPHSGRSALEKFVSRYD
jgi:hypothetical protein